MADLRVRLEPMAEGSYLSWTRETIEGFAAQQVESGVMPEREAREHAEAAFDNLLPQGMFTPDHHLWSAYDGDTAVGYLWLGIREQSDGAESYVYDVAVAPHLRGRGYGRAIMLAGEAEASALGAATIGLNVFGHNSAARGLYDSLGYAVSATSMTRRLDTTEPMTLHSGPALRLEPMTTEQFATYRSGAEEEYAANIATSGMLPVAEARRKSADDYARLLPSGLGTREHFFWTGYDGGTEVGMVWLNISAKRDGLHAFGYDFSVRQERRRRGYGRAIMVAAEQLCREREVISVGLNVFGPNQGARSLYEQMGFTVVATLMKKDL